MFTKIAILLLPLTCNLLTVQAQEENKVSVSGSIQSDMMIAPQQDATIGTSEYDNKAFLTNTYLDLTLQSRYVDAGGRFEYNQHPMPGFQDAYNNFKGYGIPNLWVKAKLKNVEATFGSYYEQFGSGFILRTYEERSLGIDNSLFGARVIVTPYKGIRVKLLSGLQRDYWAYDEHGHNWNFLPVNESCISGADAEFGIEEYIPYLKNRNSHFTIGLSWVNKIERPDEIVMADPVHRLTLPEFVNAFDARLQFQKNGFSILGEWATKSTDPNAMNSYIYSNGHAEMLSATYAKKGLSILAQAKRSENMGFRSIRSRNPLCSSVYVNHQPAFTVDQTYSLAALYPYATQMEGEWAYQGSLAYKFHGRFAPKLKVNYSLVTGLENARQNVSNLSMYGTDGAKSAYWKNGETYYQDLDFQYEQKLSKTFEHHFMYMYQQYNQTIIRGHGGNIYSHIFVYEPKIKLNRKMTLRAEAQYLYTKHESGNWAFGLLELSIAPYLMFTVSDQIGKCEPTSGEYGDVTHYYNFSVTGNYKSHRLQIGYGRTRAGYNCNGGVCRYIPAAKGVTVSYNYNF